MCGALDDALDFTKDVAGEIFSHPGEAAGAALGIPGFDPVIGGLFNSNNSLIGPTGDFTSSAWNDMDAANPGDSSALNLFQGLNGVADDIAPAIAGGAAFGAGSGLGNLFSSAGTASGNAIGDAAMSGGDFGVLGDAGGGISDAALADGGSDALGGGLSTLGSAIGPDLSGASGIGSGLSDLGGLSGAGSNLSSSLNSGLSAASSGVGGGITDTGAGDAISGAAMSPTDVTGAGGGIAGTGTDASGTTGSTSGLGSLWSGIKSAGSGLSSIQQAAKPYLSVLQGANSLYGAYQKIQLANQQKQQLSTLQNLYSPTSPYAQQLSQTMARNDAASGRYSQYGTRATNLAAQLTASQAGVLNSPNYTNLSNSSITNSTGALNTLFASLGQAGQSKSPTYGVTS